MKRIKIVVLHIARWLGLFLIARRLTARGVRILCYHGLWRGSPDFDGDSMFMSKATFERRLELIHRHGYCVISMSHAADHIAGRGEAPPAPVVITVDDGWYSTYEGMLPALKQHRAPATLYCDTASLLLGEPIYHVMTKYLYDLTSGDRTPQQLAQLEQTCDTSLSRDQRKAAAQALAASMNVDLDKIIATRNFNYMTPQDLRQAATDGLDIQLHTHNHTLHDLSPHSVEREITENRQALSRICGVAPDTLVHFCYPSGIHSPQFPRIADNLGLASSTTLQPGLAWPGMDLHLLPRYVDGEQLCDIEFEAILSGFEDLLRRPGHWLAALRLAPAPHPTRSGPDHRGEYRQSHPASQTPGPTASIRRNVT